MNDRGCDSDVCSQNVPMSAATSSVIARGCVPARGHTTDGGAWVNRRRGIGARCVVPGFIPESVVTALNVE